jgi:hemolysin activation/secretion protein
VLLLAQLVAPPVQPGPIRLPAESLPVEQPANIDRTTPLLTAPQDTPVQDPSADSPRGSQSSNDQPIPDAWVPTVNGSVPIDPDELETLLNNCRASSVSETLKTCAAALTSKLTDLGYINSRVFIAPDPAPGSLDVVLGRLVQLNVNTELPELEDYANSTLEPLIGDVLLLPRLQEALASLRGNRRIGQISGNLGRLGVDPTQAVLTLNLDPAPPQPWQGELALSNDGNGGTGQFRSINSLLKNDLMRDGDTFLAFLELNADGDPELGSTITSLTYTYPFTDKLSATGSFGYSRRQLVEAPGVSRELEFKSLQGFGQLNYEFHRSNTQIWSAFAGLSVNRKDSYLEGKSIPLIIGGGEDGWLRSGYLRLGVNGAGRIGRTTWSANLYGLQGIAGISTDDQLKELNFFGVSPGEARALGGILSTSSALTPTLNLNLTASGQVAFNELPNSLGFSIGSDTGLKGLPGSLLSGDNGWLGSAEFSWTFWNNQHHALQLSPFLGMGGISTTRGSLTVDDTIGAGGIVLRWLQGQHWTVELGWTDQFNDGDNPGFWNDWLIGDGLYADVRYRF